MNPQYSLQDVTRCNLCETAIVHSYCDICHVNLCKPCVVDHISDGYDKHRIVPFRKRKSIFIYPKCGSHLQKACEFQCKTCVVFVCSSCIASEQHRGHIFVEVVEVYNLKKEIIKRDAAEIEIRISPTYKEIVHDIENQFFNLDGSYENITTDINKQGEELHKEIDLVINEMKTEISEMKVKHRDLLHKHLVKTKQKHALIKRTLLELKEIQKSNVVSLTIDYNSKISEFNKLPSKTLLPTFTSKPIDHKKLRSFLGNITPLYIAKEGNILSAELLDYPEVVAIIPTGYDKLRKVSCINEEQIWTSGQPSDLKCFNIKGALLQTINTFVRKCSIDIILDIDGDLIYTDWFTKTVYKVDVKNDQTEELIRLQGWTPCYMCVTSTGDLLVTMYNDDENQSKVVRFSGLTETQTIQFDEKGKPLYSGNIHTKYITENRNHDICVADSSAGAVVVVNQEGKLRYRYSGDPSVDTFRPFEPYGVITDSQGRILTADRRNHCIHILDQNVTFLRCIDNCDLNNPWGLCVDKSDNLFVCEYYDGNIKKIKYLK
ncbi:uncharacterized protein LOC128182679 [Crassostrea angulata]|uniref:uncharacterized protein LOC128182679 n=1 Tax=Magallana angulata TaxID=2784310 RepID=UPI0022B108AC|nr:uncharacterized protein LOC128182679 [Crassostrea angulata]